MSEKRPPMSITKRILWLVLPAVSLTVLAAVQLARIKYGALEVSDAQLLGWGALFFCGCLFGIRGILSLNK